MAEKVVGIIGGLGPYATLDTFKKLLDSTPVTVEQDHIHVIIDSNSKIPDRTAAVSAGQGDRVRDKLIETAKTLQAAGCDFLILPCNSAHYFYDDLARAVDIPVLNIIEEVVKHIRGTHPDTKKIGVISSGLTNEAGLYDKYFKRGGFTAVKPDKAGQDRVSKAIEAVKLNAQTAQTKEAVLGVIDGLVAQGAEGVVLGCTELQLLVGDADAEIPLYDSVDILVQAAIRRAKE